MGGLIQFQYKLAPLGRLTLFSDLPKAHYSPRNWLFSRSSLPLRTCFLPIVSGEERRTQNARLLACPRSGRIGSLLHQLRRSDLDLDLPRQSSLLQLQLQPHSTTHLLVIATTLATSPIVGPSSLAVHVNVAAAYTFSNNHQSLFAPHTRYDYSTPMRPTPSS